MKNFRIFKKGTLEYVYYHGLARAKFGKKPIDILACRFSYFCIPLKIVDRNIAFKVSEFLVTEGEDKSTLLGKPFLRSEIDWAKKYEEHLSGPHKDIPFSPTSGIEECCCRYCFYRDAPLPHNPKRDCQLGEKGDMAKIYFGWPANVFLPFEINGKDVGHYCPDYLNPMAE
jgi:hypothetical protein